MQVKLGKHAPRHDPRTLKLREFITLPPAPDAVTWLNGQTDWGMMLNDELGDCTCAALGHAEQTTTLATGSMVTVPNPTVQLLYQDACGYRPGDESTDNGGNETDVLNYVRQNGLFGVDTLLAFADPNPGDITHVKQSIAYFGGIYIGLALPDSVVVDVDMLAVDWTDTSMPPNPNNGHAVWVPAFDRQYLNPITWGRVKKMSWDFWLKYCDESHVLLLNNWVKEYHALQVANLQMQQAIQALAN